MNSRYIAFSEVNRLRVMKIFNSILEFKELWSLATERFIAWWEKDLRSPLVQITVPRKGLEDRVAMLFNRWHWGFARNPGNPIETVESFVEWCRNMVFLADSYPNLWINLGPGIVAGYFGSKVFFKETTAIPEDSTVSKLVEKSGWNQSYATVWFGASADSSEVKNWDEIDSMVRFDPDNFWWRKTIEFTTLALKYRRGRYIVGLTDLGGVHDVLASLRGTQNLVKDMYYNPRKVEEISWRILELWHIYYDKLYEIVREQQYGTSAWMGLWSPGKWYPIQCDFSAILSPKLFQKFVLPILEEHCIRLDNTVYHLDGPGELPHVDFLVKIERLNGIQWVPGAAMEALNRDCGSEYWIPLYRKILEYGKNLVISVPYARVLEILEKLSTIKGVAIQVGCPNAEVAKKLLAKLVDKNIIDSEFIREIPLLV
uniref:Uroporphyrinogen decarboxylase (URO-D) domain-containing protein n=1 Tax=Ignisphaera aggregans TaxID=334771 RepID=A0A7J3JSM7_9CREN